jgi:hypothetical protein
MAIYQLTESDNTVMFIGDNMRMAIPADPENRNWQTYQAWLAEGNTPDPYVPPDGQLPSQLFTGG